MKCRNYLCGSVPHPCQAKRKEGTKNKNHSSRLAHSIQPIQKYTANFQKKKKKHIMISNSFSPLGTTAPAGNICTIRYLPFFHPSFPSFTSLLPPTPTPYKRVEKLPIHSFTTVSQNDVPYLTITHVNEGFSFSFSFYRLNPCAD